MLGLHKNLLDTIFVVFELVVNLVEVLQADTVGNHLKRIQLPGLYVLHQLLPVQVNWRLPVTDQSDTALHQGSDVEVVCLQCVSSQFLRSRRLGTYISNVDTSDAATAKVPHTLDHLVDQLASVRLSTDRQLNSVHPPLGVLASRTLKGDVRATTTAQLLELADDGGLVGNTEAQLLVVNEVKLVLVLCGPQLLDEVEPNLLVDKNDLGGALVDGEDSAHLADGSRAPDGDLVALVNGSVLDAVVRRGEHVGQVQRLLVRDVVRNGKQVHVTQGHAHVLGLAACKTAREVRVAEHACRLAAVHCVLGRVGVGALALRRELLLAEEAVAAGDLEGCHVATALLDACYLRPDLINDTAELVAKDISLFHLNYAAY